MNFKRVKSGHLYTRSRRYRRKRMYVGRTMQGIRKTLYRMNRKINYTAKMNKPEIQTVNYNDVLDVNTDGSYVQGTSNYRIAPVLTVNGDSIRLLNINVYGVLKYVNASYGEGAPAWLRVIVVKYKGNNIPLNPVSLLKNYSSLLVAAGRDPTGYELANMINSPLTEDVTDKARILFSRLYRIDETTPARSIKLNIKNIGIYNVEQGQYTGVATENQIQLYFFYASSSYSFPISFAGGFKIAYTDA